MSTNDQWGDALMALANPYRRQLLVSLSRRNPQSDTDRDPLDIVASGEEPEVQEVELTHRHLPKLEEMGFIEWDRETSKISKGPNWEHIAPIIELVRDHQDELPDGWL